ncbi:MAG: VWA domain-containing protein [Planctomycetes bacterium]|nr:VWA domain-containing protein [Planctomycetota bacterium]
MRPTAITFLLSFSAVSAQEAMPSFGHSRTREAAALGVLPTPLEVAVADIVNYHRHRLPLPHGDNDVMAELRFGNTVVGVGDEVVLQLGYTTAPGDDRADLPPLNLALVIDKSGSMEEVGKMEQVKRALTAFVERLRPTDRVALVSYDAEVAIAEPSRRLDDGRWLCDAIARLTPGGATNLHGGLIAGLREVARHASSATSNRVLLLTDGIANRGETDPERILAEASEYTAEDIDLSTIGVGRSLDVTLLDRLARGGRGLFHYVADAQDIQKVFVDEHESLVAPVARRVEADIRLPRELELVRVVGHAHRSTGGGDVTVALPNLNRGVTGVLLLVCRLRCDRGAVGRVARIESSIHYSTPGGGPRTVRAEQQLTIGTDGQELLRDPEVRKNYTIAVLAEGMHEMAEQAAARRWAAADHALQSALAFARRQFESDDDVDVERVRLMARQYSQTLKGYVDRFRDL